MATARRVFFAGAGPRRSVTTPSPGAGPCAVGRWWVGDAAGGVYAFDGTSGATIWTQRGVHEGGVLAVAIHPNRPAFATAGQDGRVLVWSAAEGRVTLALDVGNAWVENDVAWSPDGRWLAASCSRKVHAYGADGVKVWRSHDHPSTVSAIAWSSTEELATACYGQVAFFDALTGERRQKLEWMGSLVSMVLSPDGDIVACGSQDNSVHFWRRSTEQDSMMSGIFPRSRRPWPSMTPAPFWPPVETRRSRSGAFGAVVPKARGPGVLERHAQTVTALAFARRGMRLASGARDGGVVVWSLGRDGRGDPIGVAPVADAVEALYWRPDGRALAALDAQGGATVWRVSN